MIIWGDIFKPQTRRFGEIIVLYTYNFSLRNLGCIGYEDVGEQVLF
jgi:hypothetical protein